ncbi:MAG: peptidoglycan bridge formation glycyltransferase FemA/FemB family protein, partial [Solobacterium sp.]|nr:peptidoglycan bridge formation glycyltransferase FemA/FemB family protein [Solobacterium sp.]
MYLKEMSDRKTFDQYVAGNAFCHYMKTSMWGEMQKKTNGMSYRMMGLFDGNSLKGTALILEKHGLFPYLYVPKGMCLDSLDLVEEAYTLLKEYAIYRKAVFLRIDPNILRMEKDLKGNVIIGGEDHSDVTETLKTIGYVHKGYGYAYDGSWTNRFTLIVDLDDMTGVFRKFSSHRRTLIRKAEKMLMLTRRGNEQDLDCLMKLQKQLSAIKGFRPDDRAYYLNLLECFGQYADIYVTEINVDASIAHLSSYKTKKEEEKKSIADCIEVLKGYRDTYGNEIVTAAGFMFHFGNTGWCWQY